MQQLHDPVQPRAAQLHAGTGRLPPVPGEWLDRGRTLRFRFEGREYEGYAGDVVSSALWAAGVTTLGRSFKYHRPRGLLSAANHDVNVMLGDGHALNLRGDVLPLAEGADLRAVNTFGQGGVQGDRGRLLDRLAPFLPVGFYYKAFHNPKWAAPRWERFFRAVTGLGRLDFAWPRVYTAKRYDFRDVLVIGAGPAGLSAALAAARTGASVLVVDESARVGGSFSYARGGSDEGLARLGALLADARALPNLEIRSATTAAGYYADHWVPLIDAERMTKLRARAVVVASGVFEQPAVFRNNDVPGVMLASAAQRLIYRYAVKPMSRAVVLTANREGYEAALDLARFGIQVAAVIDLRAEGDDGAAARRVRELRIEIIAGHCIGEVDVARDRVAGVKVCALRGDGDAELSRSRRTISCDGVLMSVGFAPAANLLYQAGAKMRYAQEVEQFVPAVLPAGVFAAGRVNGIYEFDERVRDGERAGLEAARHLGRPVGALPMVAPEKRRPSHPYPFVAHPEGKNFVDFDEDLQLKDFFNAAREGFDNIELLKRYSTVGMGPSQGKHSNMNAVRLLAKIRGEPIEKVGTTTARPFFHPVPMSHLAGRGFTPVRRTPLHARHDALGAVWMQAGNWLRPEYYARAGLDKAQCVREEVRAVRTGAGLIDVGTLGKMDLFGTDAGEFLDRIYTARFSNLKVGMTRYAVMLDESGVVIDDGVVARLSDQHFYFTTTTTGSATVYRELTRLNTMWGLQIGVVNATGAFAAMNLAGPRSREVLQPLTAIDLSPAAFPYLAVREGDVAGVRVRMMRVGFVGELGYEIHVAADRARHLWDAIMQAGSPAGIRPFGVEAQRVLRLEKGHLIIGQDTDGLTTPYDAALEWATRMDKPFFVGQRSLKIVAQRPRRQKLVGFALPAGFAGSAPRECHLVIRNGDIAGRVTSVTFSEALGQHVGLAYVAAELAEAGRRFNIRVDDGAMVEATVVKTPFYDAAGERQKL
jgi:sarcosine oxidase subunit alpha